MINEEVIPYSEIDEEIRDICKLINYFEGIQTVESCFGHYVKPCLIWLKCDSISALNRLLCTCFNHEDRWTVQCDQGDPVWDSDTLVLNISHDNTPDILDEVFRLQRYSETCIRNGYHLPKRSKLDKHKEILKQFALWFSKDLNLPEDMREERSNRWLEDFCEETKIKERL